MVQDINPKSNPLHQAPEKNMDVALSRADAAVHAMHGQGV